MKRFFSVYAGLTWRDWGFGIEISKGCQDTSPSIDLLIGPLTVSLGDHGSCEPEPRVMIFDAETQDFTQCLSPREAYSRAVMAAMQRFHEKRRAATPQAPEANRDIREGEEQGAATRRPKDKKKAGKKRR